MKIIKFLPLVACLIYSQLGLTQSAAPWPNRTVKIVSGLGPGSSMDLVARSIAPALSEIWGQSVIVENKTGAAGNVAAGYVAGLEDDHTILIAQNAITISASFYPKLSYNLKKDLKPVTQVTSMPLVVIVNNNLPVKNLKELISKMEQFYAGMLSVAGEKDAPDYFTIELANANKSEEFIFYISASS